MEFDSWIDAFNIDQNVDLDARFEVMGPSGPNDMSYGIVVDALKTAPVHEQAQIRQALIKIKSYDGDVRYCYRHLAQALAV